VNVADFDINQCIPDVAVPF